MRLRHLFLAASFASFPASSFAATVHVVSFAPGPGVDFTSAQAAVDAAAPGDVILFRQGAYGSVTIAGKGITLVADAGAIVHLSAPFSFSASMGPQSFHNVVRDVPAGQRVVFRGIGSMRGLEIVDCDGAVWIEDCTVGGTAPALRAIDSVRVDLIRGSVNGPSGYVDTAVQTIVPTGDAAWIVGSHFCAVGASIVGGDGKDFAFTQLGPTSPTDAGRGLVLDSGATAWLEASTITGGTGGDGAGSRAQLYCFNGGNGGVGLRVIASTATLRNASILGGPGGSVVGSCLFWTLSPGIGANAVDVVSGSVTTSDFSGGSIALSSPTRESQSTTLSLTGSANGAAVLFVGTSLATGPAATPLGSTLVSPSTFVALIPLGPAGSIGVPVTLPLLPAGIDAASLFTQAAFCSSVDGCAFGAASELTVLDSSY
ncbi:MAG: hypothetical protein IPH13_15970 [Planctomycetes bacterium]|nr:hypothetical protein [Planctomycetota bacterium]MCC7171659.1 hypothetical protein [Planctomycetota bacterium]